MKRLEKKSYKETTVLFLSNGTLLQTNNDIEFDENIRAGLEAAVYCAHCHYVNKLVEKFSGGERISHKKKPLKTKSKSFLKRKVFGM